MNTNENRGSARFAIKSLAAAALMSGGLALLGLGLGSGTAQAGGCAYDDVINGNQHDSGEPCEPPSLVIPKPRAPIPSLPKKEWEPHIPQPKPDFPPKPVESLPEIAPPVLPMK